MNIVQYIFNSTCNNGTILMYREEEGVKLIKEMKERYSAIALGTNKFVVPNNDNSLLDLVSSTIAT